MPLTPYTIESFGGLRLDVDPLEAGPSAATDLVNVDLDRLGRLRTRSGFTRAKALTITTAEGFTVYDNTIARQIIAGYTTGGTSRYEAYLSSGGASIASVIVTSGAVIQSAITGENGFMYMTNGVDAIRRWDGSSFSSPAGMPVCSCLAATALSNRLVAASVGGLSSRVLFSNAGAPETFTYSTVPTPDTGDYVDVALGQGFITGAVTWQNDVYVFKDQVGFFIFYGEDTDTDGQPIFLYRPVFGYGAYGCVAGDEGVYFHDGRTVWITTGGVPTRLSTPVEPYLRGLVAINGETVSQTDLITWRISYSLGRLYLSVITSSGSRRTLVFDPKLNTWTLYSLTVDFAHTLRLPAWEPKTFYLSPSGVDEFDGSATDNGSAITWSNTSGRYPLSDPGRVAVTLDSSLDGSGTVALRLDSDLYTNQNGTATLGTAPATAEGFVSGIDIEGRWVQHTLSGTGQAVVSRLTHHVSSVKPTGVR